MFNKNDPLIDSVTKVMKENQSIRDAERAVNEEFGIAGKRDLPYQFHAEYDALVEEVAKEALVGGQAKLDVNKNNRLDKHDFKMLRGMKKKPESVQERAGIAGSATGLSGASGSTSTAGSGTGSANAAPMTGPTIRPASRAPTIRPTSAAPTIRNKRRSDMEEQQVNTAGKSDKMTSAPATATILKPLNKPGLPKLGGMTVIQKGAMKEEAIKKERGKKVASAILAKMRAKAGMEEEIVQEKVGPNPDVVKADQMRRAGDVTTSRILAREPSAPPPSTTYTSPRAGAVQAYQGRQTDARMAAREPSAPPAQSPMGNIRGGSGNVVQPKDTKAEPKAIPGGADKAKEMEKTKPNYDSMSFGDAFKAAREAAKAKGAESTGQFTYKGKDYQTNVAGEKYVAGKKQTKVNEALLASELRSIKNIGGGIGGGGNK